MTKAEVRLELAILLWRRYQSGDQAAVPVIAKGGKGTVLLDPEEEAILEALYPRWGIPFIGGA